VSIPRNIRVTGALATGAEAITIKFEYGCSRATFVDSLVILEAARGLLDFQERPARRAVAAPFRSQRCGAFSGP
jgi:hypothetical protein